MLQTVRALGYLQVESQFPVSTFLVVKWYTCCPIVGSAFVEH